MGNNSIYYDYNKCLSYQRFLNSLTGGRGIGKTYGCQKLLIKDFLKNGNQFVWLRRYKSELKVAKSGFFNKIQNEFPNVKFEIKGNSIFINEKLAGCFSALSTSSTNKGNSLLTNARTCVFDEYIIDTTSGLQRYLPNEMRTLFDLLETFFRTNPNTRVFFLSNNVSEINPLYTYFGINFEKNKVWVDTDIYAENLETSQEFIELKNKSPIARLTQKYDEEYYNYNVNNEVLNDSNKFVREPFKKAIQMFTIVDKLNYYIFKAHEEGQIYFYASTEGNQNTNMKFTFDIERVNDNVYYIDKTAKFTAIQTLVSFYKRGLLYFDSVETKMFFFEHLKKYF